MKLYDVPAPLAHIPMRQPTLNPLQALFVMNSAFVQEQAKALAEQVAGEADTGSEEFRRCTARSSRECDARRNGARRRSISRSADTARYAQALLSTNEVIFWP